MGPEDLKSYLKDVLGKPFELGSHDCIIFANTCWHKLFGYGWADQWLGTYVKNGRWVPQSRLRAQMGFDTFEEAINSVMPRNLDRFPIRGSLVAVNTEEFYAGLAVGIAVDHRAAFVGPEGLTYIPIADVDKVWHPTLLKDKVNDV